MHSVAVRDGAMLTGHQAVSVPAQLREAAQELRTWLFGAALPLWWDRGADRTRGGFHELLDQDGAAPPAPRRARVQARQAFVYAAAGQAGWDGDWTQASRHGLDYLDAKYRRADGLYRSLITPDGEPLDETARLYDQAFVLLALAKLRAMCPQDSMLEAQAQDLVNRLSAFRHDPCGFREASDNPYQSNALMHLLEAALAWMEVSPSRVWRVLASELVEHALAHFVDPESGCLYEFFDASWRPEDAGAGRIVDPGHQFEWSWLLSRWSQLSGEAAPAAVGRELFEAGMRGVCPSRALVMDEIWSDFSPKRATARLWPQTEWLKAALVVGAQEGRWGPALGAVLALNSYLETPIRGLWWDVRHPNGAAQRQSAPASSFYHIVGAILELDRLVGAEGAARGP